MLKSFPILSITFLIFQPVSASDFVKENNNFKKKFSAKESLQKISKNLDLNSSTQRKKFEIALNSLNDNAFILTHSEKQKTEWAQAYKNTYSHNTRDIFYGLKTIIEVPNQYIINRSRHEYSITMGYKNLRQLSKNKPKYNNQESYAHISAYLDIMVKRYSHLKIWDYNLDVVDQTFRSLSTRYSVPLSEVVNDFKKLCKTVDTDQFTKEYLKSSPREIDEDSTSVTVEIQDEYDARLFKLFLEPVNKVLRHNNSIPARIDQVDLITNALPVPQHAAVITSIKKPLATGGIHDCVAIYAYTKTKHGLIHYDRYCLANNIKKFLHDLKRKSGKKKSISIQLLTNRCTTQLQNIFNFLKGYGVHHISIMVDQPNFFHSQPSRYYHLDGKDYYTHLFLDKYTESYYELNGYKAMDITCSKGKIIHGKTVNTTAAEKLSDGNTDYFLRVIKDGKNKKNLYLKKFHELCKEKYLFQTDSLDYLY